jgi:hypothetical protein
VKPDDRLLCRLAFGIAALAVIVRVWMAWQTHSTAEDFLITLRYADNIAHGRGFVYNSGERVLGTTTPLYTLLLALAAALHLNAALVGKACNLLADGVTCYLLARLLARREIGQPLAGLFAALLYALSSTPLNISIGGMETGLVTCAGMVAITAYVARRSTVLYLAIALLFLLRIDGLLLGLILAVGLALRTRQLPRRDLGLALLTVLPWFLFACLYFGSPIPTSLIAKLFVYTHGQETPRRLILDAFATQFLTGWFQRGITLLFVLGAARILWPLSLPPSPKGKGESSGASVPSPLPFRGRVGGEAEGVGVLVAPLLWLLIYYGTMLTSHVPPFAWYFLPPWPLFLGIAALGGGWLCSLIGQRLPETTVASLGRAWLPALAAFGLFGLMHLRSVRADIARTQWQEDSLRVPMGLWFHTHAQPTERILLEPIGYVGYYSQRPILDMIGLVSPEVFVSYHTDRPLADMVSRFRPEWLCLRSAEVAALHREDSALPDRSYRYIREFHVPGRAPDFLIYRREQDSIPTRAQ